MTFDKSGKSHWVIQRLTAVILIPLTIYFLYGLVTHGASGSYADISTWLRHPLVSMMMSLLILSGFHHTALGVEVILQDYVHGKLCKPLILLCQSMCLGLAMVGVMALFKIVTGQ